MAQGESGMAPKGPGTKDGVYATSHRRMGDATTENIQGWNSYACTDKAKDTAAIKGSGKMKPSGGGDY